MLCSLTVLGFRRSPRSKRQHRRQYTHASSPYHICCCALQVVCSLKYGLDSSLLLLRHVLPASAGHKDAEVHPRLRPLPGVCHVQDRRRGRQQQHGRGAAKNSPHDPAAGATVFAFALAGAVPALSARMCRSCLRYAARPYRLATAVQLGFVWAPRVVFLHLCCHDGWQPAVEACDSRRSSLHMYTPWCAACAWLWVSPLHCSPWVCARDWLCRCGSPTCHWLVLTRRRRSW